MLRYSPKTLSALSVHCPFRNALAPRFRFVESGDIAVLAIDTSQVCKRGTCRTPQASCCTLLECLESGFRVQALSAVLIQHVECGYFGFAQMAPEVGQDLPRMQRECPDAAIKSALVQRQRK